MKDTKQRIKKECISQLDDESSVVAAAVVMLNKLHMVNFYK